MTKLHLNWNTTINTPNIEISENFYNNIVGDYCECFTDKMKEISDFFNGLYFESQQAFECLIDSLHENYKIEKLLEINAFLEKKGGQGDFLLIIEKK